jgi:hypothetical protein
LTAHHHIPFTALSGSGTGGETAMNARSRFTCIQGSGGVGSRLSGAAFIAVPRSSLQRERILARERPTT